MFYFIFLEIKHHYQTFEKYNIILKIILTLLNGNDSENQIVHIPIYKYISLYEHTEVLKPFNEVKRSNS